MSTKKYSALVLGANGLVGIQLVDLLLKNDKYSTVYAVSRTGIDRDNPKLVQIIADFETIEEKITSIGIDHLFSCLGSTKNKTPNKAAYYQIDHDYPIKVAAILKNNGCQFVAIVSSMLADPNSKNFYLRLKGETEKDLIAEAIESTNIFRPSLLKGKRNENRFLEKIAGIFSRLVDMLLVGRFKNLRSIDADKVASAMVHIATFSSKGVYIYKTEEIKKIA